MQKPQIWSLIGSCGSKRWTGQEIEDSSLSCWEEQGGWISQGSSLDKKKMNLVGPWFLEEGTESLPIEVSFCTILINVLRVVDCLKYYRIYLYRK